jgi:hypothetical protein
MANGKIKQALIIADPHFPFQDQRAYDLMLTVAQDIPALSEIVLLGDVADFYGISSFSKDPSVNSNLMREVNIVNEKLDELDELFPKAKKIFIEGNHEFRIIKFISNKAPELFGMVTLEELFRLRKRQYTFVPYTPAQIYQVAGSKLYARHEGLGGSAYVARNSVIKSGCSLIFGHSHCIQESQVVMMNGDNLRGICTGWLGNKNSSVMHYVKQHHQWALGFSVVDILPDGTFFNHLIHIIVTKNKYYCSYNGTIYEG